MSKYSCKEFVLCIVLLMFSFQLFAQKPHIEFTSQTSVFVLYNTDNQKMYSYYSVPSKSTMSFTASFIDTLDIFTRIKYDDDAEKRKYEYIITYDSSKDTIRKTCKKSSVTRGINGESMSSYNKLQIALQKETTIKIYNPSSEDILFKFGYGLLSNFTSKHEYIPYSPDVYHDERILLLDDKEFTYYDTGKDGIELDLEGPIYVKIMSRVLFDMPGTQKIDYQFEVYDNGTLLSSFKEVGHKSTKSILTNNIELIPSTGDVNILHFDKGRHHIEMKNASNNHEVIFRLYINKTAVFVGDK